MNDRAFSALTPRGAGYLSVGVILQSAQLVRAQLRCTPAAATPILSQAIANDTRTRSDAFKVTDGTFE